MKRIELLALPLMMLLSGALISCNDSESGSGTYLRVDSSQPMTFGPNGEEPQQISVESNGRWLVSQPDGTEWLTVTPAEGEGTSTVSVSVSVNTYETDREAVLTVVSADDPSQSAKVKVVQTKNGDIDVFDYIVDANFREYCRQFDTDGDGRLSLAESREVLYIDITPSANASAKELVLSVAGIEYFANLQSLACSNNLISDLDLSRNTALLELICINNTLTEIDLSALTKLEYLYLDRNNLTSIDVTNNTKLKVLRLEENSIGALDVSNCSELTDLDFIYNNVKEIDLSNNTALLNLSVDVNQLTSLDVTMLPSLERLNCSSNALTELDVTQNPKLLVLNCAKNQIEYLNVANCPEMNTFYCGQNLLTEIDITKNAKLTSFHAGNNLFERLDLTGCPDMVQFLCSGQPNLTEIDLSNCNAASLVSFACYDNDKKVLIWVWPGFAGPDAGWTVSGDFEFKEKE